MLTHVGWRVILIFYLLFCACVFISICMMFFMSDLFTSFVICTVFVGILLSRSDIIEDMTSRLKLTERNSRKMILWSGLDWLLILCVYSREGMTSECWFPSKSYFGLQTLVDLHSESVCVAENNTCTSFWPRNSKLWIRIELTKLWRSYKGYTGFRGWVTMCIFYYKILFRCNWSNDC